MIDQKNLFSAQHELFPSQPLAPDKPRNQDFARIASGKTLAIAIVCRTRLENSRLATKQTLELFPGAPVAQHSLLPECTPSAQVSALAEYCRSGGRVCPAPIYWNALWELLPNKTRVGSGWSPSLPLILGGWWYSTDGEKRQVLVEHILWAEKHSVLSETGRYLRSLSEDEWHHENE
jgi:hypothetical protein